MREKQKTMTTGQLICMAVFASFLIVLLRQLGVGGAIGGALAGGGGALIGAGIYHLFKPNE